MSKAAPRSIRDFAGSVLNVSSFGLIPDTAAGGNQPSVAPPVVPNPEGRYLAKPRKAGAASEGAARDRLEEEKRRRFKEYEETLLGSAGLAQYLGQPEPGQGQ